jgi:hypothetical protein
MCDRSAFGHLNHNSRRPVTCGFVSSDVSEGGLEPNHLRAVTCNDTRLSVTPLHFATPGCS